MHVYQEQIQLPLEYLERKVPAHGRSEYKSVKDKVGSMFFFLNSFICAKYILEFRSGACSFLNRFVKKFS